jgi:quercetin dioxygenase-like cupin family protein
MTQNALQSDGTTAGYNDAGEARWWWGNLAVITVTGEQTRGGLAVVELTMGPRRMAPLHVHHREEETFVVLEGSLTVHVGDQSILAAPGDIVVGPRDVPHRFVAGEQGARLLLVITPAGLEGLIREQSVPATACTLPAPGTPPPDLAHAREIALRYDCELLV